MWLAQMLYSLAHARGWGFEPDTVITKKFPSQHWQNLGCHVAPSDWGMCCIMIHLYGTINTQSVNMHNQLPHHHRTTMWHATSTYVLPSHLPNQLPCHILYNPVTLPRQHPYNLVTMQRQHPYSHLSSTLPRAILSLGHAMYGLPHFICTLPRVNSILVQLNPKIQN
jgi:hypothetical protein